MRSLEQLLLAKRVLMLQGPMGSFFTRVAQWLNTQDIVAYQVNFNGGDQFFNRHSQTIDYRGTLHSFEYWLIDVMHSLDIDTVVCFGDCRFYHTIAKKVCLTQGIKFLVFEEGYLRPDYITLEAGGVNGYSQMQLSTMVEVNSAQDLSQPTHSRFSVMVWSACLYYLAWICLQWRYPHYQHHRLMTPAQEFVAWSKSFFRRIFNYFGDGLRRRYIDRNWRYQYYVVALQVHNDSQIKVHSQYADVESFIVETMTSFAAHALPSHRLVIKHHPMDRGYRNYRKLIQTTAATLGIDSRVIYVCDVHLPSLIRGGLGLVAINSTTGLQALFHAKPVKVMGHAIYDLPQLTCQKPLNEFWRQPTPVDRKTYWRFRHLLIAGSQLNGSFYGQSPWMFVTREQLFANRRRYALLYRTPASLVRLHG